MYNRNDNNELEGIVILGHPRSGTTLLRRLLNGHEHLFCPGETHVLNSAARFIQSEKTALGLDMGVLSGLSFAGIREQSVIDNLREFSFSLLRQAAKEQGNVRWVEKTAADSFYINEIETIFAKHCYFIGIVRHGLDVAISSKGYSDSAGMYLNMFKPFIAQYEQPLEAMLRSWISVTENLLQFAQRNQKNCILIRYEDLLDEPEEVLANLMDFIGEPFSKDMMSVGLNNTKDVGLSDYKCLQQTKISKSSTNRWQQIAPHQLHHLAQIANPLLTQLGYDEIECSQQISTDDARRNYELSMMIQSEDSVDKKVD